MPARTRWSLSAMAVALVVAACTANVTVSVSTSGEVADRGVTGGFDVSETGRFITFASDATNLGADSQFISQIWLRDLQAGTTRLVSSAFGCSATPCDPANGASTSPRISADGRFIVFASNADDLLAPGVDDNDASDIYRADMTTGVVEAVSISTGDSWDPSISDDGNRIAFTSSGVMTAGDTNGAFDVYVRTMSPLGFERVSLHADGSEAAGSSLDAEISGDGQAVAFESTSALVAGEPDGVFLRADDTTVHLYDLDLSGCGLACLLRNGIEVTGIDRTGAHVSVWGHASTSLATFLKSEVGVIDTATGAWDVQYRISTWEPIIGDVGAYQSRVDDSGTLFTFRDSSDHLALEPLDGGPRRVIARAFDADESPLDVYGTAALSGDATTVVFERFESFPRRLQISLVDMPVVSTLTPSGALTPGSSRTVSIEGSGFQDDLLLHSGTAGLTLSGVVVVRSTHATAVASVDATVAPGAHDLVARTVRADLGGLQGLSHCAGCLVVDP